MVINIIREYLFLGFRRFWVRKFYKVKIGKNVRIGRDVKFDKAYGNAIEIGSYSSITAEVMILAHDHTRRKHSIKTIIGDRVFIGTRSIILPGVKVGNDSIIGAGSVVTKNIPDGSIAAGNPAKLIRTGIVLDERARIVECIEK